jgi:hypothetical protein
VVIPVDSSLQVLGDISYCKTKLFTHQKNNIIRMLNIHHTPTSIYLTDNMPIYFENDLIFDMAINNFISQEDIPLFHITSGMILDDPGTGKTLQFILYLLEIKLKGLVVVPDDTIKYDVWVSQFRYHINDSCTIPFDILTFDELSNELSSNKTFLNKYEVIGIDEIHNLYKSNQYNEIFNIIIMSNIKYRWGITGTPFVNDASLFHIIKFPERMIFSHLI